MNETIDSFPYAEDGVIPGDTSEQYRFPIILHPWPRWNYITAVVVDSDRNEAFRIFVRPTDEELAIVGSFHEYYCDCWYNATYRAKMRERPFDIDGSANGRILAKYRNGGWGYNHRSWQYGPTFVPEWNEPPMGLIAVLDREQGYGLDEVNEQWEQWKRNHPEVFGQEAS